MVLVETYRSRAGVDVCGDRGEGGGEGGGEGEEGGGEAHIEDGVGANEAGEADCLCWLFW